MKFRAIVAAFALLVGGVCAPALADAPPVLSATNITQVTNLSSLVNVSGKTIYWVGINNTQSVATYVQFFNSSTTPTLGSNVVLQATCPATSYCYVVLGAGVYFPLGAWVGASTAINGAVASATGNMVYVGNY